MLPRLLLAAALTALMLPSSARAESLLGPWSNVRALAEVDRPSALVAGPDRRVWYTAPGTSSIGAIDADGRATAYALPGVVEQRPVYGLGASAVLPNADGTVWALDVRARLGLWRLADGHLLRRVPMLASPGDDAFPAWRTPDGSIWVADDDVLAQMRPDGSVVRLRPFGRDGDAEVGAVGPDGRLWLYGHRARYRHRLVKVDEQGRIKSFELGEDPYEGASLTWETHGVVSGDMLWQPAVRTFRGRDEAVLLGAAPGRPMRQVRLGVKPNESGWDGGISIGAGPGGALLVAEGGGTVGVVEGATFRKLVTLSAGDQPQAPVLDAAGRIWVSLSGGRLAAVDSAGAVARHGDGIPRDRTPPRLTVELGSRSLARLLRGDLRVRIGCDVSCGAEIHLAIPRATARRLGMRGSGLQLVPIPKGWVPVATAAPNRPVSGERVARFKLARGARRALAGAGSLRVRLLASAFDQSLDLARQSRGLTLR